MSGQKKNYVGTAAFRLRQDTDLAALLGDYYVFNVPEHWPGLLQQIWQRNWSSFHADRYPSMGPVNKALRAIAPDIIDTAAKIGPDAAPGWLYSRNRARSNLLKRITQAYMLDLLGDEATFADLRDACEALDVEAHQDDWTLAVPGADWIRTSPGGTAVLERSLYRLLPEVAAEHILARARTHPYEGALRFAQVPCDDGAELMSWPPKEYTTANKNNETQTWYFSAVLHLQMRTVPFDSEPRLHISASIRRWVTSKVFIPPRRSVSVYLRTTPAVGPGEPEPRFAMPALKWDRGRKETVWRGGGPAQILGRLAFIDAFPELAQVRTDPGSFLRSHLGYDLGVVHHTQMGGHGVEAGIMPDERRNLIAWAASALPAEFEPAVGLRRTNHPNQAAPGQYTDRVSTPREPKAPKADAEWESQEAKTKAEKEYKEQFKIWEAERDDAAAANAIVDGDNAAVRRARLTQALGSEELRIDALTSTTRIRTALTEAAAAWLGLDATPVDGEPNQFLFTCPGLAVRLTFHAGGHLLGDLGRLTGKTSHEAAEAHRAKEIRALLESQPHRSELVLAEIPEREHYRTDRKADPYRAIRVGAAEAGRVTQFITTGGKKKEVPHRARAAFGDGMRQLGIRLLPPHTSDLQIPDDFDQVAFWLVRRNTTAEMHHSLYTPIAILIRPGQPRIMARTADSDDWMTYPQLLCELATSPPRAEHLRYEDAQREEVARLIRTTLPSLRGRHTLVLAEATNLRSRWSWLTDEGLTDGTLRIGDGQAKALAVVGPKLRVVRTRLENSRAETPAWWATSAKAADETAGFTTGLWQREDAETAARVYYSLTEKSAKLNTRPTAARKFTDYQYKGVKPAEPGETMPVPRLLEITVAGLSRADEDASAADWAMFVHQQRYCAEHPEGLQLPYALAMAHRTNQYALPHEDDEYVSDDDSDQDDNTFEQLTLF
ncbi:pPIWI_RE module domain-containing protein [Glycomyces sp. MUSA5-2]|uniref:pPIWI_RE module domain-containing protein n=1 Tax=Glycomyces sp. MUSA5-2 TaxID=2053002 RepID=UPI003009D74D